ncbi:MAG: alanine racemase [Bryobacteraceae bacterium]|nr:alanine racemase [Bryobacteraceae bacterium]
MRVSELETPALVIDLDIMDRNLRRVADYARQHELRLRPHTKTHKLPVLGRQQLDLGAAGLTVAKVGEAEVMLSAQPPELLVAYPVIGRRKLERLMQVARQTRITVSLDGAFAAKQLSDAAREAQLEVGVLAEVDVGQGRMGVSPGEPLLELGRQIARMPRLNLEGITFYPGHVKAPDEEGREKVAQLSELMQQITTDWKRAGLPLQIVSGGSTPLLFESHQIAGLNEIRPGTYIFNDRNTWYNGACAFEDCAGSIIATVVSTSRPQQMIIDGGSKTFSSDRLVGEAGVSFGYVTDAPEAIFNKMNEEHGYIELRNVRREFTVGDRVRIVPNHICVCMNLHEKVYGIRGDQVISEWRVEGRGKLQ